ncbi:MAG: ABC transporter ATP-binding protein/permease [Thermoleophilia bacterium]|nr:ABC transporter ATP-binding protein/permease [Thermoleophilia bacterium]
MIDLPVADPGRPDTRSPIRLLVWVGRHQIGSLLVAIIFGIIWMVAQALMPYAIGQAIQQGIVDDNTDALIRFCTLLAVLGVVQAVAGVLRHRYAVQNWLAASFRLIQVVGHHAARSGACVRAELSTGEVVATVSNDALRAGGAYEILARLVGSVVSYLVVAAILLATSIELGLIVLLGLPLLTLSLSFVIKPLQLRQREQRDEVGLLTALGADTAAGLRVLRGVGGEDVFFDRYQQRSEAVRRSGVRVATPQSTLDAAQVLLPGLFVVLVTWLGAHLAASGEISAGELIAFYGYAGFLVIPLRTAAEAVEKFTRAHVGARKMLRVLAVERAVEDPVEALPEPPIGASLVDRDSGLSIEPGSLTCLVSATPDETSALADRLGRLVDDCGVMLGDTPLDRLPLDVVRRRILVSEPDPLIFSGTLRSELDPWGRSSDDEITTAIEVAAAEDVLVALPAGLDEVVDERGRSFSGGQRQRLVLVRALLSNAEILVLVEPTSAVDAHTEARIAAQLHHFRAGRTTVVMTASPLVLDRADTVVLIADGEVQASGTHRDLLRTSPVYRDVVVRSEVS